MPLTGRSWDELGVHGPERWEIDEAVTVRGEQGPSSMVCGRLTGHIYPLGQFKATKVIEDSPTVRSKRMKIRRSRRTAI